MPCALPKSRSVRRRCRPTSQRTSRGRASDVHGGYRNSSGANSFRYARQLGQVWPPSVAEDADLAELVEIGQSNVEILLEAHRQPRDGNVLSLARKVETSLARRPLRRVTGAYPARVAFARVQAARQQSLPRSPSTVPPMRGPGIRSYMARRYSCRVGLVSTQASSDDVAECLPHLAFLPVTVVDDLALRVDSHHGAPRKVVRRPRRLPDRCRAARSGEGRYISAMLCAAISRSGRAPENGLGAETLSHLTPMSAACGLPSGNRCQDSPPLICIRSYTVRA